MRFAIPSPPARPFRLGRNILDWPLAYRLALIVLPSALLVALVAVWFGYSAVSSSLSESLRNLPLFEAKLQASTMGDALKELRQSMDRLAQSQRHDAQFYSENLELYFQNNYEIIREITYNHPEKQGFHLIRNSRGFIAMPPEEVRTDYSAFQQIDPQLLEPGKARLFPAVLINDSSAAKDQPSRSAIIRMALKNADGGIISIGIDLAALSERLTGLFSAQSPLRLPSQAGSTQLAFFFDADGWILFEMMENRANGPRHLPDIARQGYTGDLGRAGFDSAFRPWTSHETYWRMVTDALMGRSGSIPAPADKYLTRQMGEAGLLCFAPVVFAASDDTESTPVGGIAFFETTALSLHAFLRVANYSIAILVGTIVLFGLLFWRISRELGSPLSLMARKLAGMGNPENLAFINTPPAFAEQQKIQSAINKIISSAMLNHKELERLSQEMQQARSRLPVSLTRLLEKTRAHPDLGLVGSSPQIEEVRRHVQKAAKAGTDVLIWGETGTGKELVAAAIHKASSRSAGPYVSINCGALDENLLLDALFGHVKGAFTEAREDRKGAFLSANGGTLHLDEIANASPKVQQALLRALSVRRIRALGSDAETPFNTRVVAATNVDLRECVREGTFREDLYYRLAIINIETPPLRHRKADIPELASYLIREAALALGRPEAGLSRGALDMMTAYDWPGNVRELKNCITRAMAFVDGDIILPEHVVLGQDASRAYAKPLPGTLLSEKEHGDTVARIAKSFHSAQTPLEAKTPSGVDGPVESGPPANQKQRSFLRGIVHAASSLLPSGGKNNGSARPAPPPVTGQEFPHPPAHYPAAYIFGSPELSAPHAPVQLPPYPAGPEPLGASPAVPPAEAKPDAPDDPRLAELNERQLRAIALLRAKGEFTRAQYEAVAGSDISSRTAQNDLRELVERGILERAGAGPGTRYIPCRTEPDRTGSL